METQSCHNKATTAVGADTPLHTSDALIVLQCTAYVLSHKRGKVEEGKGACMHEQGLCAAMRRSYLRSACICARTARLLALGGARSVKYANKFFL